MSTIIDPDQIRKELSNLERKLSAQTTRTTLFNLVIITDEHTKNKPEQALSFLLGKRAARIIHITLTEKEKTSFTVSARCSRAPEQKSVCFQEINLKNGTDDAGKAPGTWIPLLIRDIPTFFYWLIPLESDPNFFQHIKEQADKVLIDSSIFTERDTNPDTIFLQIKQTLVDEQIPFEDFVWQRLTPLRKITAQAFDLNENTTLLSHISSVSVVGGEKGFIYVYFGWLFYLLGWEKNGKLLSEGQVGESGGAPHIRDTAHVRDTNGREIALSHRVSPTEKDKGISISFTFFTSTKPLIIECTSPGCAKIHLPSENTIRRVTSIPPDGEILLKNVDFFHSGPLFRNILSSIV